ncbi:hypothetical protein MNBD_GAMMA05-2317 [hydrothermal vent metagenome]|uniref:LPS-assembly lipoprotein RlpB (Rare lipoprotein B) n=1 Tax=hydrothermal vent metagenome TaxID=652676 RepID=A0A3B0WV82_9ZZZZ
MFYSSTQLRFLTAVVLVCVLQACGFALRGSVELSPDMSPLFLQKNSVLELGRDLESLLISSKVNLVDDAKRSNAQLALVKESKKRRVLSVDSNGRAREYLLSYTVIFSIKINSESDAIAKPAVEDNVSLSRSLLFDSSAVLAVANESEVLYKDMRRDAARLILLKLQAHSNK